MDDNLNRQIESNLRLWILNSRDIYLSMEWLMNALSKKVAKGTTIDPERLLKSSVVAQIDYQARKIAREAGEYIPKRLDKDVVRRVRQYITDFVMEGVNVLNL